MNSEKVKEIKELIDCDKKQNELGGIIVVNRQFLIEVIALINDLENRLEVERIVLKERSAKLEKAEHDRDRYKRRITDLESENKKLMKLQARGGYRVAELGIENQQLKDRIAELEKERAKNAQCLMQFAERLFKKYSYDKLTHEPDEDIEIHLTASELDETLKEFLGGVK